MNINEICEIKYQFSFDKHLTSQAMLSLSVSLFMIM